MRVYHLNAATLCPMSARLVNGAGGLARRPSKASRLSRCSSSRQSRAGARRIEPRPCRHRPTRHGSVRSGSDDWRPSSIPRRPPPRRWWSPWASPSPTSATSCSHTSTSTTPEASQTSRMRSCMSTTREHHAALNGEGTRANVRYVGAHFRERSRWRLFGDGGERWFDFDGVRALHDDEPDILLVPLAGHTVGHTGVAIRSDGRWLLHAAMRTSSTVRSRRRRQPRSSFGSFSGEATWTARCGSPIRRGCAVSWSSTATRSRPLRPRPAGVASSSRDVDPVRVSRAPDVPSRRARNLPWSRVVVHTPEVALETLH